MGEGVNLLGQKLIRLVGIVSAGIIFMDSRVAEHADLVVVFAGGLGDDPFIIKSVNGARQIWFHNTGLVTQTMNHEFQGLPCLDHG